MNIDKIIKKRLKQIKRTYKKQPFTYFVKAKKVIRDYYKYNSFNERQLVARYNNLYRGSEINPSGISAFGLSVISGIVASAFFQYIAGKDNNYMNSISTIKNIIGSLFSIGTPVPIIIIIFILLIIVIIFIPVLLLILPILIVIYRQQDKLKIELDQYELSVIKDILNSKVNSQKLKARKVQIMRSSSNISYQ